MARYRSSIDLGAFIGTRFFSIKDEQGRDIPGIFIPTAINGIDVREDSRSKNQNQSKIRAFINFLQRNYSPAFLSAARDRLVAKGENPTPYNVPAWQQCYMLPEEKRTVIRAALKKRVIAEHPELASMEDVKGNELAAAISRLMPFQMGDSYLVEEQQQQSTSGNTYAPSAQQVAGYTPMQAAPSEQPWAPPTSEDDMPF